MGIVFPVSFEKGEGFGSLGCNWILYLKPIFF